MARRSAVTVEISGTQRLNRRLEDLPDEIRQALVRVVRESAEAVRDDTKANVRVDTGNLRDSVGITYEEDGLVAEVGWKDRADFYAAFHEHGTRRFPAQPALAPALEKERRNHRRRLTAELREVLR